MAYYAHESAGHLSHVLTDFLQWHARRHGCWTQNTRTKEELGIESILAADHRWSPAFMSRASRVGFNALVVVVVAIVVAALGTGRSCTRCPLHP